MDLDGHDSLAPERPPHLRLAWSNPNPPLPRRPLDLALAIQRHLAGADGLSEEQFLRAYSGRERRR
jgi:hypothetical protein